MDDEAQEQRISPPEKFSTFVNFFSDLFQQTNFLESANCSESYKRYVPEYYRKLFGAGVDVSSTRHLKWYRRLSPLFSLPPGSTILDYGGGYGLDSIFLASLGYRVCFYEITPNHIGIARCLAGRYADKFGDLGISFVLSGTDPEPQNMDAVFANEVAHHIEPADSLFVRGAAMLRDNGHLFLLEPNFMNPAVQAFFFRVRGFRTTKMIPDELTGAMLLYGDEHIRPVHVWNRYARSGGFRPRKITYIASWVKGARNAEAACSPVAVERVPVIRAVACSHVTIEYLKAAP